VSGASAKPRAAPEAGRDTSFFRAMTVPFEASIAQFKHLSITYIMPI
jgi:hypothetical protein